MGGEHMQCGYTGQRDESRPGWGSARFHHDTQNGAQLITCKLFTYKFNL